MSYAGEPCVFASRPSPQSTNMTNCLVCVIVNGNGDDGDANDAKLHSSKSRCAWRGLLSFTAQINLAFHRFIHIPIPKLPIICPCIRLRGSYFSDRKFANSRIEFSLQHTCNLHLIEATPFVFLRVKPCLRHCLKGVPITVDFSLLAGVSPLGE